MLRRIGLCGHSELLRQDPVERHLCGCLVVSLGNPAHCGVAEHRAATHRAVGHGHYRILVAEGHDALGVPGHPGVKLHLVHCRRNACEAHHLINLFAVEVGDADRLHQPFINKLFHFTPRLFKRNVSVLHGAVLILWHVRLLRVEHERHRPVDQIQIQVLQLQRLETLHKGRLDRLRAVPGVPELARHEHLLSLDAGGECGLQAISHLGLIQVDECGIHVPVSHLQSVLHSSLHLTRLGLPSPQTQQRHLGSGVQSRAHCGGHGLDRKWADSNSQFT
mmetsp:Transcript_31895/g.77766  ORF Transcript_31895/g.77766 Transcript_31895/m.77766 type:complete len:277 (+) Transcript_31895:198-1028(+)